MSQPGNTTFDSDIQALTSPKVVAQFDSGLKQISESLVAIRDGFSSIEKDLETIPGAGVHTLDWKDLRQVCCTSPLSVASSVAHSSLLSSQRFTPIDATFRGTSNILRVFLECESHVDNVVK